MNPYDKKIAELDLQVPEPKAPLANFVPYTVVGNMIYISGQRDEKRIPEIKKALMKSI